MRIPTARRQHVVANHGETLAEVAARVLPDVDDALQRLSAWNLHLVYRRSPTERPGELLGTDLVYLDAAATSDGEPQITSARLAAGHDGLAEVAIDVRYTNGAQRSMSLPYEAVVDALDAAAITSLDDLVGRSWTVLVPPPSP